MAADVGHDRRVVGVLGEPLVGLGPGAALDPDALVAEEAEDLGADLGDVVALPGLVGPGARLGERVGASGLLDPARRRRSLGGLAHLAQLLLQVSDLVADAGRELEVQVAGRLVHLGGELLDQPGEVGGRHRLGPAGPEGDVGGCRATAAATAVALAARLRPAGAEQLLGVGVLTRRAGR